MSTCISRMGEYSEHELDESGEHRFVCRRCWVLDEDQIIATLDEAESRVASVQSLAERAARKSYDLNPEDVLTALAHPTAQRETNGGGGRG